MLKETKSELEHAIAETERPLRINNECIKNREARISIDLVKDEVQFNSLNTNLSGCGRIQIVWPDPDPVFLPSGRIHKNIISFTVIKKLGFFHDP